MLSELAQELYELGKKALAGDENALMKFIILYRKEYVENLDYADITRAEKKILFTIYTAGDTCELDAKTRDELDDEYCYAIDEVLEEIKTWKIVEKLEELDKVQVVE